MDETNGAERNEYVQALPAPALRPFVAWYGGYRQQGLAPGRHRGLPSPYLTLIVTLDEPLVIAAHPDPAQPASRHDTLLGGLHTSPALIEHDGHQAGVQVSLHPLGARALLGLPAGELAGLDVDADQVVGPVMHELHERVGFAATWGQRFAAIDEVLFRCITYPGAGTARAPSDAVGHAWMRLLAARGCLSVAQLVDETGYSPRHLSASFRTETGLTPKTAARVIRFDAVRRQLQAQASAGVAGGLADIAVVYGFYDQAHLAREFRELAGCPPSRWLAEEVTNVQAAAALVEAP